MASILRQGLPTPVTRPAATLPIRYSAAAAAAVTPTANQQGNLPQLPPQSQPTAETVAPSNLPSVTPTVPPIPPSVSQATSMDLSGDLSSPSLTHLSVTSPMLSSASVSHQPDGSFYSGQESPVLSEAVPSSVGGPAATSSPQRVLASRKGVSESHLASSFNPNAFCADSVSSPPATTQSPSAAVSLLNDEAWDSIHTNIVTAIALAGGDATTTTPTQRKLAAYTSSRPSTFWAFTTATTSATIQSEHPGSSVNELPIAKRVPATATVPSRRQGTAGIGRTVHSFVARTSSATTPDRWCTKTAFDIAAGCSTAIGCCQCLPRLIVRPCCIVREREAKGYVLFILL
jgi:hypothetical protein